MEAVFIIVALVLLFAFLGLGVYATVKVVGAAKRGVDRTITQARRTVEDTTLRARSFGQVGVAGALAQLRLDLRTSMRATQQALYQGVQTDASLKESLGLFERLSAHGHELDDELKRLEAEPDRKRTEASLPDLRERTAKITEASDSLRWAARDRARRFAADDLSALSDQIEVESGALRDWSRESIDDLAFPGSPQASPAAPATGSWGAPQTPVTPPAALAQPVAAPQYPWQKSPRPETTT
ncbi:MULTISPECIES: hypothetical protein [unclassified Streptomyces]|uniref:hypothetical protein n=1 Tax=unclassified Streptomyces TaxID=2593676 RepID=UPI000DC7B5FE|nr:MULTISPECIES: hypothetical protein [unclassified Streptomyces]AWZ03815.1 hypothetical protein DRB89_03270 [Streptomyces sp. ICC4]AWZ11409.1 hypothetical protein DRB96_02700 [Streptomyces sp. ICC1]